MANIKNRKRLQLIQTIWDVMLYSQHFTFHWKLLGLASRIEKSGTGDNNFAKWKGTFRSDRPKWPDRSQWTTFKAGPEYSGRTKPKWSVPFDVPTEITGILGWMESALGLPDRVTRSAGVKICQVNVSRWGNPPGRGRIRDTWNSRKIHFASFIVKLTIESHCTEGRSKSNKWV